MQKVSVQAYVYAGVYKCFYETATKKVFSNADIDNNIKYFEKIRKIIDFEKYKNMLVDLQKKCNVRELKTITPNVLVYYAKIYKTNNKEK